MIVLNARLIEMITTEGGCPLSFTYDDQNRVLTSLQCDTAEIYTYYKDSVVYDHMIAGVTEYRYIYLLNNAGLATSYTKTANGSVSYFYLQYNSTGQLIKWIDSTHTGTYKVFTIQKNNIVNEVSVSTIVNDDNYTIATTYYSDTDNQLASDNFGKTFLGKTSVNIKKSDSYHTPEGDYVLNYTYELDNMNGIATRTATSNGTVTETVDFDYVD